MQSVTRSVFSLLERAILSSSGGSVRLISYGTTESGREVKRQRTETTNIKEEPKTIWADYKRNFKGAVPPERTRIRCRRGPDKIVNNACPICKNNISIAYTDTQLLEQFISPHTGEVYEATKTGLCRQQQKKMVAAIEKAWDYGLLPYPIPRKPEEEVFRIPPWNKIDTV